jgi:hypothetical protein
LAIDIDNTVSDLYRLSRHPNDALDQLSVRSARVTKDNDVTPLRFLQSIEKLANDQVLLVCQGGVHAMAHHPVVLEYKRPDQKVD